MYWWSDEVSYSPALRFICLKLPIWHNWNWTASLLPQVQQCSAETDHRGVVLGKISSTEQSFRSYLRACKQEKGEQTVPFVWHVEAASVTSTSEGSESRYPAASNYRHPDGNLACLACSVLFLDVWYSLKVIKCSKQTDDRHFMLLISVEKMAVLDLPRIDRLITEQKPRAKVLIRHSHCFVHTKSFVQ